MTLWGKTPIVFRSRSGSDPNLRNVLAGLKILVLEDEFLIAMDVEQLCRDHGASDVEVCATLKEDLADVTSFDAAIIDVMLGGRSTLDFAMRLKERDVPFIFSTGYADNQDIAQRFPGVAVVGKPFSGEVLISAVAAACRRSPAAGPSPGN
jgi:CheY-like chemotaxis protein